MFFLKYLIKYLQRYYKVEQGLEYVEALRHLNKPSEVTVPNELIPAGVLMQLRGLMNCHVLSLHSEWVWPYWMERQTDPHSDAFIPRAMNLTYLNLTHRNWTGIGFCQRRNEAIVDPRGAITPWNNGWSLDTWLWDGSTLHVPSRATPGQVKQRRYENLPWVFTEISFANISLVLEAFPVHIEDHDYVVQFATVLNCGETPFTGALVFSLRPSNPEGISLIHEIAFNTKGFWLVNGRFAAYVPERPSRWHVSNQARGDVAKSLWSDHASEHIAHCRAGLCTGACAYDLSLQRGESKKIFIVMPLEEMNPRRITIEFLSAGKIENARQESYHEWQSKMSEGMSIRISDHRYEKCFAANKATLLLLHDDSEITAGPFTYHRHWFRDAAYMLYALDMLGYHKLVANVLRTYPARQWKNGYFCAQKGEWDSNGQAIWSIVEHYRFSGDVNLLRELYPHCKRAALWIEKKRHDVTVTKKKPRGLLPAGFSAEHLGPNDFYYWDNFWALRGIEDVIEAARVLGYTQDAREFRAIADRYLQDLLASIHYELEHNPDQVLPAAPGRPPDAGMIGNVVAAYPLHLFDIRTTPWLAKTVRFIRDHLFHREAFYQEMIHSGINSYLTLQMAQCLLQLGDTSAFELMEYMLSLASPTLCWPEAIHPRTYGGCMGDGHHGWAAAEWIILLRSLLIQEADQTLHVTRSTPRSWIQKDTVLGAANAPTYFGQVSFTSRYAANTAHLEIQPHWINPPEEICWHVGVPIENEIKVSQGAVKEMGYDYLVFSPDTREISVKIKRHAI